MPHQRLNLNNMDFTPEQKKNLISKPYRLNNLYKIINKDKQLVQFNLNPAQADFLKNREARNICLKSRQLGFTTLSIIDMLDDILWNPNFHALFLSYDDPSALDIFDTKVVLAWDHFLFKKFFQVDTDRANKIKVGFGDGTFSSISVKSSGRAGTYNRVHISEFGRICYKYPAKAYEILTGTIPSVPLGGTLDIESTAETDYGHFYDMFWEAWNRPLGRPLRPTELKAHFYNWQWDTAEIEKITEPDSEIPSDFRDYQKQHNEKAAKYPGKFLPINDIQLTYWFYKWIQAKRDWKFLFTNYPTTPEEAFVSSGSKLFALEKVDQLSESLQAGTDYNGWTIYDDYISGHQYAIAADPSEGVGQDSCAAVVWDFTPVRPRVVATYSNNKIAPDIFAFELKTLGARYGFCLIAVERNNHGFATLTRLKDIYPTGMIYRTIKEGGIYEKESDKYGWDTNLATKPKMFYDFSTAVNDQLIEIPDRQLLHEIRIFDRNELNAVKADPLASNHFDLLTAAVIGWQMRSQMMFSEPLSAYETPPTCSDPYSAI